MFFTRFLGTTKNDLPVQRKLDSAKDSLLIFDIEWLTEKREVEKKLTSIFQCNDIITDDQGNDSAERCLIINEDLKNYTYTYKRKENQPLGQYMGCIVNSLEVDYISNNNGKTKYIYKVFAFFKKISKDDYIRLRRFFHGNNKVAEDSGNQVLYIDSNNNILKMQYLGKLPWYPIKPEADIIAEPMLGITCICEEVNSLVSYSQKAYDQITKVRGNINLDDVTDRLGMLRFDGFYGFYRNNRFFIYRFYDDGTVIYSPTLGNDLSGYKKWFNRESPNMIIGTYTVNQNTITFTLESRTGKVDYWGEIRDSNLLLSSHSHISGKSAKDIEAAFYPFGDS